MRIAAHFQEHLWVPQGTAAAITGNPVFVDYDDFWWGCRHDAQALSKEFGRIILRAAATASFEGASICVRAQLSLVSAPAQHP